jgi:hypothetical protein
VHESDQLLDGIGTGRLLRRPDDGRLDVIGEELREVGSSSERVDVCLERRAYFVSGHVVLRGDEHLVAVGYERRPTASPTNVPPLCWHVKSAVHPSGARRHAARALLP